jgi:PAS domain S-box-containing protein
VGTKRFRAARTGHAAATAALSPPLVVGANGPRYPWGSTRYSNVSRRACELTFRTTSDGRYTHVSPNVRRILGYAPSEMMARSPLETVHPDDLTQLTAAGDRLAAGSDYETVLVRKRHADGHYVWLAAHITPVRDRETAKVLEIQVTARDATMQVATERALRRRGPEAATITTPAPAPVTSPVASSNGTRSVIEDVIAIGAFQPLFQPVANLSTRDVVGFEALTRFDDGTPPELRFNEAAEVGMGVPLEHATLRAAVDAASELPPGGFLSVNVSPALILERAAIAAVVRAASRPLVLELTEREPVDDYSDLASALDGFGSVRLAVDDAGAGYASLRHILALHPSYIKIDITWVRGIDDDMAQQALVAGINHFAMLTNCRMIAEGIETESEAQALRHLGIEFGQGFLVGYPQPAEALA